MMSLANILGFLLLLTVVSAARNYKKSSKACSLQLQKIISSPLDQEGLYSDKEIEKWADEIRIATPLLFTPNNASVYWTLEQKYGMNIIVYDGFGNNWAYYINPPAVYYYSVGGMGANVNKALLNYPGFTYRTDSQKLHYSFTIWNTDGRYLLITFFIKRDD